MSSENFVRCAKLKGKAGKNIHRDSIRDIKKLPKYFHGVEALTSS